MDLPSSIIVEVLSFTDTDSGALFPEVLTALESAISFHNSGQYQKAYDTLCNINTEKLIMFGADGQEYIYIFSGCILQSAGRYNDAIVKFLSAKQIIDQKEQYDLSYALLLSCIATVYMHLSQFSKAMPYLKKALLIRQQILGEEHADVAILLNNIAVCYTYLNLADSSYEEILTLLNKAYKILYKELGVNHPRFAIVLGNISKEKSRISLKRTYSLRPLSPNVIKN